MLTVTSRPLTYRDYYDLPEHGPRYQLIEGDLFVAPAPSRYHQDISKNIQFCLMKYFESNPVGTVYDAPFDVKLTDINVYQPDLIVVLERSRYIFNDQGADGAPDIVVEILSSKTAKLDVGVKREIYARTGVGELWILNPENDSLQQYDLRQNAEKPLRTLLKHDQLKTPLLPDFVVKLEQVFQLY